MNILWVAKGKYEGEDIYLTHHIKPTKVELIQAIMDVAWTEGFKGILTQRLKMLGWEIVQIEFNEVKPKAN